MLPGKYLPLLAASLRRKRLRTFFTVASILIAFLLYGLAASMQFALQSGVDVAGADATTRTPGAAAGSTSARGVGSRRGTDGRADSVGGSERLACIAGEDEWPADTGSSEDPTVIASGTTLPGVSRRAVIGSMRRGSGGSVARTTRSVSSGRSSMVSTGGPSSPAAPEWTWAMVTAPTPLAESE